MENNYGINSFESLNIKTYSTHSTVLQIINYLKFCENVEIIFSKEIKEVLLKSSPAQFVLTFLHSVLNVYFVLLISRKCCD